MPDSCANALRPIPGQAGGSGCPNAYAAHSPNRRAQDRSSGSPIAVDPMTSLIPNPYRNARMHDMSCILAFRYGFGISEVIGSTAIGDPLDLSWARRFGLWAAYAFGQPLPPAWPGIGRNAFAHESGIHADGALKDRGN